LGAIEKTYNMDLSLSREIFLQIHVLAMLPAINAVHFSLEIPCSTCPVLFIPKVYNKAAKSHVHTEWETRWNKYLDTRTNPTPAEERNWPKTLGK
jgi:hypothetical protein